MKLQERMGLTFLPVEHFLPLLKTVTASYSFEAITNTTEENIRTSLGAAFFDANATGNLESLRSIVGVYESYIDDNQGKGIFAMWHIKDLLPK